MARRGKNEDVLFESVMMQSLRFDNAVSFKSDLVRENRLECVPVCVCAVVCSEAKSRDLKASAFGWSLNFYDMKSAFRWYTQARPNRKHILHGARGFNTKNFQSFLILNRLRNCDIQTERFIFVYFFQI